MSILLLEKNVGLRNLMRGLIEDRAEGIFVEEGEKPSEVGGILNKIYAYRLVIMSWEDFGRTTLDAILNKSRDLRLAPQIWVLTEDDTRIIHSEAFEANLILSKKEHFSPEVLKALAKRCYENEEEKMRSLG